jgi:malate synthase
MNSSALTESEHGAAADAQAHGGEQVPYLEVIGTQEPGFETILTEDALQFVTELHRLFSGARHDRLAERMRKRFEIGNGRDPKFRDDTAHIREDDSWQIADFAPGLEDRRVEITGPVDPLSTVVALNSGANIWLADLEDATSPTWHNVLGGQLSLYRAIRGELVAEDAQGNPVTVNAEHTPTIVMRPRGWHLVEKHIRFVDKNGHSTPASGSLVEYGLYVFLNARELLTRGAGPYFYLPKIESTEEAQLWDDIFSYTERYLELNHGTIRATVLIETLPAAFEMDEILHALRDHSAGLNAGRWDYLFSIIKNYRGRGARFVLPDRSEVTMTVPFMRAFTELLVKTCHRRGAHAIGGKSSFIPTHATPEESERILSVVIANKEREADDGYDGTWVSAPEVVPVAQAAFDRVLQGRPNQVARQRDDVEVSAGELLDVRMGSDITDAGVYENVLMALTYIESWLRGHGTVEMNNLSDDASAAEISRSQIWQWIHQEQNTAEGTVITRAWVEGVINQVLADVTRGDTDRFDAAAEIFRDVALSDTFPTFFTVTAYSRYLVDLP